MLFVLYISLKQNRIGKQMEKKTEEKNKSFSNFKFGIKFKTKQNMSGTNMGHVMLYNIFTYISSNPSKQANDTMFDY